MEVAVWDGALPKPQVNSVTLAPEPLGLDASLNHCSEILDLLMGVVRASIPANGEAELFDGIDRNRPFIISSNGDGSTLNVCSSLRYDPTKAHSYHEFLQLLASKLDGRAQVENGTLVCTKSELVEAINAMAIEYQHYRGDGGKSLGQKFKEIARRDGPCR